MKVFVPVVDAGPRRLLFASTLLTTPSIAVVGEFRSMRSDVHRQQLIARVPFEAAGAVGSEIAIRVNGSTYVQCRHRNDL